ncbi:50S ribosomal protein L25 [Elusimicrobiota bacterium]
MAEELEILAELRGSNISKGDLTIARKNLKIPGVIYGGKEKSVPVWISWKELDKILRKSVSTNLLFRVSFKDEDKAAIGKGKAPRVLIKEIQYDPVRGQAVHIDLLRVALTQRVEVSVKIKLFGEAKGVKVQSGILEHLIRELKLRCLATAIPSEVRVDITELEIGKSMFVKDLQIPEGVELLTDRNSVVVHVVAPAKEEEVKPDEAVATEPEVMSKGKKEEVPAEGKEAAASPEKKQPPEKKQ